jgi:hypothetical protein
MSEFRQVVGSCLHHHLLPPISGLVVDYALPRLLILVCVQSETVTILVYNPEILAWKRLQFIDLPSKFNFTCIYRNARNDRRQMLIVDNPEFPKSTESQGMMSYERLRALAICSEATVSFANGSESAGTFASGSEATGTFASGSEATGTFASGGEATGTFANGSESAGSFTSGSETAGTFTRGAGEAQVSIGKNEFQWSETERHIPDSITTIYSHLWHFQFHSPGESIFTRFSTLGTYIIVTHANSEKQIHKVPELTGRRFSRAPSCDVDVIHFHQAEAGGLNRFYMIYNLEHHSSLVYLPLVEVGGIHRPDRQQFQWLSVGIPGPIATVPVASFSELQIFPLGQHKLGLLDEHLIVLLDTWRNTFKITCFTCTPKNDQHIWQALPEIYAKSPPLFINTA